MKSRATLLLLLSGCAARWAGIPPEPAPTDGSWERLAKGSVHLRAGRASEALAEGRQLVQAYPWWVEGHRLVQDARSALFQSGPLLLEYSALAEAQPARPEAWYLLGRISGPARAQEGHFRRALAARPDFAWALGGLAWVKAGRGERKAAIALLERALASSPRTLEFALSLADRLGEGERDERARGLDLLGRLAREVPSDPRPLARIAILERGPVGLLAGLKAVALEPESNLTVQALAVHLEDSGLEAAQTARLWLERLERGASPLAPQARLLLARLRARTGDARGAQALLLDSSKRSPLEAADRERLGILLCAQGRWQEGLEALLAWVPESFPLRGPTAGARLALLDAGPEVEPVTVAELLARAGFQAAARATGGARRETLDRIEEALLLESGLGLHLAAGEGNSRELTELLEQLRALSLALLGRDVVGKPKLISVFGAGVYLDPGGPGLPAFFLERGRMLFLGKRVGRPPEAYTGRLVSAVSERLSVMGREVPIRCWLVEGSGIRPSRGMADLAGLALGRDYLIDLDAIRSWSAALRRQAARGERVNVLEQPLAPKQGPHGLWSPSDLAAKLVVLALREEGPPLEDRLFELVRHHELAHLADAALHLPPLAHLSRVALLLLRAGLSPSGVEADLETRAQCWTLARTAWPRLALAQAAMALPSGADGQGGPHDVGYARLVLALVRRTQGGTAGLFRLEPAELSRLGREVAAEMRLSDFAVTPRRGALALRSPCVPGPHGSSAE